MIGGWLYGDCVCAGVEPEPVKLDETSGSLFLVRWLLGFDGGCSVAGPLLPMAVRPFE